MRPTECTIRSAAAGREQDADAPPPAGNGDSAEDACEIHRLYREHSPALVRRLTRQTGCREVALELTHEAFVRLLRMAPSRVGSIARPGAYLRSMCANLVSDWGRAQATARRSRDELEAFGDDELDQLAILESRDTLRRLEKAMERLKPRTREIFLAHRLEGLTYSEIAERTGLSVKGVEKQMSKAIAKIDRLLDRG